MSDFSTPVNKQAATLLSRKTRVETVSDALDLAAMNVCGPAFKAAIAEIFSEGKFGPEPVLTMSISVRKNGDLSGRFAVVTRTKVVHTVTEGRTLFGLEAK